MHLKDIAHGSVAADSKKYFTGRKLVRKQQQQTNRLTKTKSEKKKISEISVKGKVINK